MLIQFSDWEYSFYLLIFTASNEDQNQVEKSWS